MGKTIHLYAHTHWDREWYFTTSRSKVYLMKELADVLDTLEKEPKFTSFLIDGQASLIDEYLAWRPQDAERVKKAISDRRLMVGPWYTQCDQIIISAESVVRNMYYGISRSRELGHSMMVGYVPDCFGQGGNMPQIYRAFGIKDAVIVRGVSDDMAKHTNFIWRGSDGSEVITSQMRTGYSIAEWIPSDPEEADEFWRAVCLEQEAPRFASRHVLFPVGFDQAPIRRELPRIVEERNRRDPENTYVLDTLEGYTEAVRDENPKMETVEGELLSGKLRRLHRSIYSSRSDLKALNTKTQNYVTNVLEPLLSLSYALGNDYPHEAVESIWKLLFENSAHDSIGSCVADTVNEDVRLRYKQANDIAASLVELHSRLIATAIAGTEDRFTITLINTLPTERGGVILKKLYIPGEDFALEDADGNAVAYTVVAKRDLTDYVKKQTINLNPSRKIYVPEQIFEATVAIDASTVPAFGYTQLQVVLGKDGRHRSASLAQLENEYYAIEVNSDGSLKITDKQNGHVYNHEAVLVENGDDGDSFNYSPPREDVEVRSTSFVPTVTLSGSDVYQRAQIAFDMRVPADLEARAGGICDATLPVTLCVGLRRDSKVIDLSVHVDNCVKSHRMCILLDADVATKTNMADELFGSIERPNYLKQEMDWYKRDQANGVVWNEVPVAIQPTQSFVGLFGEGRGLAVIPEGVREYEIVDKSGSEEGKGNIIRLTLFRTYGYMGKEDLLYRPGHASGEETIATPAAQLQGPLDFSLGLVALQSDYDESGMAEIAKSYNTPLQAYEYASFLNGRLMFSEPEIVGSKQRECSLMRLEGGLSLSAIKKAEHAKGLVIRLYNAKRNTAQGAHLRLGKAPAKAAYLNLLEEEQEDAAIEGNEVIVDPIAPSKFVTLYVEY